MALLGAVALATSAHASVTSPPGTLSEVKPPSLPLSPEPASGTVPTVPSPEVPVKTTGSSPVSEVPAKTTGSSPVSEAPGGTTGTNPVSAEPPASTTGANPAPEPPAGATGTTPPLEEPAKEPTKASEEPTGHKGVGGSGQEPGETLPAAPVIPDVSSALQPAVTRTDAGGEAAAQVATEAGPEAQGALIGSGPPSGGGPEAPAAADVGAVSVGAAAALTAAQGRSEFSCELSALGGAETDSCTSGSLGDQDLLSESPIGAAAASVVTAVGSPADGGHGGGSAVGSPPVSPAPGPPPAPSGASGSGTGATGLALTGFLTLAGLLLLGAPRAMRRLRLACEPWLTACFVLIPERPG